VTIRWRVVSTALVAIFISLVLWWALTDAKVKTWPENVRVTYARGALLEYLELRCLDPERVTFVGDVSPKVHGTYVGSFSAAEYSLVWRIGNDRIDYPVMISVFPDAEFGATWWYDANDAEKLDAFSTSTLWAADSLTLRTPLRAEIAAASGIRMHRDCGNPKQPGR
jgi:hypothetical protein